MRYTATDGTARHGEVWSPGPVTGSVWVLPYTGAPSAEAVAVHLTKRAQLTDQQIADRRGVWNFDEYAHESDPDRRLPAKDWHAALGYDPRDVVRQAEQLELTDAAWRETPGSR